jgi:hypothetical protein
MDSDSPNKTETVAIDIPSLHPHPLNGDDGGDDGGEREPVELNFFDNDVSFTQPLHIKDAQSSNEKMCNINMNIEEIKVWDVPLTNAPNDFQEFYHSEINKEWNFNDMYVRSNSPMASNCNSDVEADMDIKQDPDQIPEEFEWSNMIPTEKQTYRRGLIPRRTVQTHKNTSEDDRDINENRLLLNRTGPYGTKYKKFTYADIENSLSQYYHKTENNFTEMDLISTYLNGLRLIYIYSRDITEFKYYCVIMSAITVNVYLVIIAQLIKDAYWGPYLISSGSAFATLFVVLSYFLKSDSNSAQYLIATQFDKLEFRIESQPALAKPTSQKMRDIEPAITEMRGYINYVISDEAVKLFPLIYRVNIMQFIKKTELYRKNLIIRFRDIKNEIHYILHKWNMVGEEFDKIDANYKSKSPHQEREKNRVLYLMNLKEKTKLELMQCKYIYSQLDELFKKEIRYAKKHKSYFGCGGVFKPDYDVSKLNTVVRDYLKLILPE